MYQRMPSSKSYELGMNCNRAQAEETIKLQGRTWKKHLKFF